ncbi:MAG: hypothetical protein Q4Q07_05780 [Tissierellia bacterium]|nr:hypothetical protein [Tissierellia bacterium]
MVVGGIIYTILAVIFIKLYKKIEKTWCLWILLLIGFSFFGTTPLYEKLPFNGKMFFVAISLILGIYILGLISKGVSEEKQEYRRSRRIQRRRKSEVEEIKGKRKKYKINFRPSFTVTKGIKKEH